jgi:hypothetical protein
MALPTSFLSIFQVPTTSFMLSFVLHLALFPNFYSFYLILGTP